MAASHDRGAFFNNCTVKVARPSHAFIAACKESFTVKQRPFTDAVQ